MSRIIALGAGASVSAALVLVMFLISVATLTLVLTRDGTKTKTPKGLRAAASSAASRVAGAGMPTTSAAALDVIPLRWDPQALVYMVSFRVGAVNTVDAAFDTGSAQFVVATSACASCTGRLYDPAASPSSLALYDPRSSGGKELCQTVIAYGSQTDTITMFRDTLRFERSSLPQPSVLCAATTLDAALATAHAGVPFVIDAFPVAGVTANTGSSSLNVFGMSAVKSVTKLGALYLLPSCQTSRVPAYESAMLQAAAGYLLNNSPSTDMVWSMALGAQSGFFLFAALRLDCMAVHYTPLVPSLPTADSPLSRTPGRYYVVRVASWTVTPQGGATVPLDGAPAMLVVDTGTTTCMVAPAAAATMSALKPGDVSVLTLRNSGGSNSGPSPQITFTAASTTFGGGSPVFTPISSSLATTFSSDGSVGILGATALRGLYIEFNLTRQLMGVGYM